MTNYSTNRQTSGESASLPQYDEGTEWLPIGKSRVSPLLCMMKVRNQPKLRRFMQNQNGPKPKRTITKTDYTKTDHNQNGLPEKNMYCKNIYLFKILKNTCSYLPLRSNVCFI
jgi:hypothetical protein